MLSSVFIICFMAADRYFQIKSAPRVRKRSNQFYQIGSLICWMVSIGLTFPGLVWELPKNYRLNLEAKNVKWPYNPKAWCLRRAKSRPTLSSVADWAGGIVYLRKLLKQNSLFKILVNLQQSFDILCLGTQSVYAIFKLFSGNHFIKSDWNWRCYPMQSGMGFLDKIWLWGAQVNSDRNWFVLSKSRWKTFKMRYLSPNFRAILLAYHRFDMVNWGA